MSFDSPCTPYPRLADGDILRPLICLTMIVKNEAEVIEQMLAAVKPYIDRLVVHDTGSTDETPELVTGVLAGMRGGGTLIRGDFVDFSMARNTALAEAAQHGPAVFTLTLDADDELEGGEALRAFLEERRDVVGPEHDAYNIEVVAGGSSFDSARVLRVDRGWRYMGAVHEVPLFPGRPPASIRVPGVRILHSVYGVSNSHARRRARWQQDLELLRRAVRANPHDPRPQFYLGLTHLWLGEYMQAIDELNRRVKMGGWAEEVFQAKYHEAQARQLAVGSHTIPTPLKPHMTWPGALEAYLEAHALAPHRAEPLVRIAQHYDAEGEHALTFLYARRAYELPYPVKDTLFIEKAVYDWVAADLVAISAYYVGEFVVGTAAARKALAHMPGNARLQENLEHYLKR